ncbi:MAG: molybdopterin converting factor subunit 1 [Mesorhizobium amorphae]|nr:MAG: molybdopterin converting factor subunit 1 [Mesorhizobium amorphae]
MSEPVRLHYFAWVRERIGRAEEEVTLPPHVATVTDLLGWLQGRGEGYAEALKHPPTIRVALDRRHAPHGTRIGNAREIALFPPMTGG